MIRWRWRNETEPPEPTAVVGIGAASRRLLAVVAALGTRERAALRATANQDVLVVTGPAAALPWANGVRYAAPRAEAPAVWLPTTERPDVALDLVERALRVRHPQTPLLLWREPPQIVPLNRLLPATDALLARIEALWNR
ncbi:hypothetical protein [Tahibacter soli]|uniref:MoxR-vWA-beta-propeller ternary system domain-containing protein n=1 Tax=Tahibacter soli TaxID=2983605 RepID=A0A9X3YKH0_9GAMM|nr:hypothetical protein [Tahibacter soli]MDC8013989.1 hypothetical protein [Tahibacter soli]